MSGGDGTIVKLVWHKLCHGIHAYDSFLLLIAFRLFYPDAHGVTSITDDKAIRHSSVCEYGGDV